MAKYIKLLMVALFATMTFALTSCGDDDDEPSTANIVGTWKGIDKFSVEDYYTVIDSYMQFKSDGKYIEIDAFDDGDIDIVKGTWTLDGNTLTMNANNEYGFTVPYTVTVKKITNKELTVTVFGIERTYKRVTDSEIDKYL